MVPENNLNLFPLIPRLGVQHTKSGAHPMIYSSGISICKNATFFKFPCTFRCAMAAPMMHLWKSKKKTLPQRLSPSRTGGKPANLSVLD